MFVISLAGVFVVTVKFKRALSAQTGISARECSHKNKSTSTRVLRVEALDQRLR